MKKIAIKCNKCDGKGTIDGFAHIRNGICFDCNGTGTRYLSPKSVTAGRAFINKYLQSGFFPENQSEMTKIFCYGYPEHETAQQWVLKNCDFYYFGQPICRSSTWYKVPLNEVSEFIEHFNKVTKSTVII